MTTRIELTTPPVNPGRLLLLALATTFAGEYTIMRTLPYVLPEDYGATWEAIVDACLLTVIVAPVLWMVAVWPIQKLAQSRMVFLRRALTSQEEERQRITRELHDGIGQSLTSLMLSLRAMEETTVDPRVCEQMQLLRSMGAGIHDDLRRIVQGLRPAILDQMGLVAAIQRLVDDFRQTSNATVELDARGLDGLRLSPDLESTAFRIVQEAVSNAVRHASASRLQVSIGVKNDLLTLQIQDNGTGFEGTTLPADGRGSYGLLSIRERAMIAGGQAEILTTSGKGTIVTARLPLMLRTDDHE